MNSFTLRLALVLGFMGLWLLLGGNADGDWVAPLAGIYVTPYLQLDYGAELVPGRGVEVLHPGQIPPMGTVRITTRGGGYVIATRPRGGSSVIIPVNDSGVAYWQPCPDLRSQVTGVWTFRVLKRRGQLGAPERLRQAPAGALIVADSVYQAGGSAECTVTDAGGCVGTALAHLDVYSSIGGLVRTFSSALGRFDALNHLSPGLYLVQGRCGSGRSPIQQITVKEVRSTLF